MSLTIEKAFTLDVPVEEAWAFLTDPRAVVTCLPGAQVTEQIGERAYAGAVTVKVGPVSVTYRGRAEFERLDPASHEAVLFGRGQDVKGKGGVDMRMTSRLRPAGPARTEVTVTSEVGVTGRLAQFGRGMIEEVADQVFAQFTAAVDERLRARAAATGATDAPREAGPARSAERRQGSPVPGGGGQEAAPPAPLRGLPFALRVLGRWLTRPFRRRAA
jgi:carbon monoxide dehydrogenase subunit G